MAGSFLSLINLLELDREWKNLKMLLVDEDIEIQNMFVAAFSGQCTKCDIAENEYDALKLITINREYDIYFIDRGLPKITSLGLEKWIRLHNKEIGRSCDIFMISHSHSSPVVTRRDYLYV